MSARFRPRCAVLLIACLTFLVARSALGQAIPGDANRDGRYGQGDVVATLDQILHGTTPAGNADCTVDAAVDVRDLVCLANLFEATVPRITAFAPTMAAAGTLVTLAGEQLTLPDGRPAQVLLARLGGGTIEAPLAGASLSSLAFVVPAGATSGPVTVVVPERSPAVSTAVLTVPLPRGFELLAEPTAPWVIRGQSTAVRVGLTSPDGSGQLVELAISGLPAGITASFRPTRIAPGQSSILTLSASPTMGLGGVDLLVSAQATISGTAVTATAALGLTVAPVSTTFQGRIVVADAAQTPLAGATVRFLGRNGSGGTTVCSAQTTSDAAGTFVLSELPAGCVGPQLVRYDGATATAPPGEYAEVDKLVQLVAEQVTDLGMPIHLPRLDDWPRVLIRQNAATDQTFTFAAIPDLQITVYAGTTLQFEDGSTPDPFPLIALEVPVDRLPGAMPATPTTVTPFFVAFQPTVTASQPVAVWFPNPLEAAPGTAATLLTLDPALGVMVTYGTGRISGNGRQVVPDLDPARPGRRYGIVRFDWHGPVQPPPPRVDPPPPDNGDCPIGTKPIDPATGIEILTETDVRLSGPRGELALTRTYRTLAGNAGPFGIGTGHNYDFRLDSNNPAGLAVINLILPDGNRIPFVREQDGLLRNTTVPRFAGATLATSGANSTLRLAEGTTIVFTARTAALGSTAGAITDRFGNRVTLVRDAARPARITDVVDPVGRRLRLSYDAADRITEVRDPIGRTTRYAYNAQGTLATVTDPAGGVTGYTYDAQNRLLTVTDARGVVLARNSYDANGRATEQIQADGGVWRFAYTLANPLAPLSPVLETRVTDPRGHESLHRFSPQGYLLSVTDALGQTRVIERESGTNRVVRVTGTADCDVCVGGADDYSLSYTPSGQVAAVTNALGHTTTFEYESIFATLTRVTDALGNSASAAVDELGRVVSVTDARGHGTSYDYGEHGLVEAVTDAAGNVTHFERDGFGHPIALTDPTGRRIELVFDAVSRLTEVVDPLGRSSRLTYDDLDRVSAIVDPLGRTVSFTYDAVGNLLALTDPRGSTTSFTYDAMGRVTSRTDPRGATSTWQYDPHGNVIRFVDRRGLESLFAYDELDRPTAEVYADATVTRVYDARGRLLEARDTEGGESSFAYDALGQLRRAVGPTGTVEWTRDVLGRVTRRQVAGLPGVDYAFDAVGNLLSATLAGLGTSFEYDALDRPIRETRTNGVVTETRYDPLGRILELTHRRGGTVLDQQLYGYDGAGQRSSVRGTTVRPLATPASEASYDPLGNRLLSWNDTSFAHDAEGQRLAASSSVGTTLFSWDGRGRLAGLTRADGTSEAFAYDFAGNLISRTTTGSGDPRSRSFVLDERTNWAAASDQGLSRPLLAGLGLDQHWGQLEPEGALSALRDALGSTVALTDASGQVTTTFAYEPFGATTPSTPTDFPFQFTGRVPIDENLYYYRARFYDPATGRFLSEDPIGFLGGDSNVYRYAGNDPVDFADPTGLIGIKVTFVGFPITIAPGIKVPLTHAGVVAIDPKSGRAVYFEYGRYDKKQLGVVREFKLDPVRIGLDGQVDENSVDDLIERLTRDRGKGSLVLTTRNDDASFKEIVKFSRKRAKDRARKQYSLNPFNFNTCLTFADEAFAAGLP
ncbi:MAG: RHS repeat-associated core domain-containing protein [Thermoanaerobaculia bacterium]|nr:RHS repeat-associated core domain-containing protein [Thermoanaerobaculia bacterium]